MVRSWTSTTEWDTDQMTTSAPITGMEAIKALIEGHAIRMRCWTPINRLVRVYDEFLEEHLIIARGTDLFVHDCQTGGSTWILERLLESKPVWELWINNMEEEYQDWCRENGVDPA